MRIPALELNPDGTISNCEQIQCKTQVTGYRVDKGPFNLYPSGLLILKPGFSWPIRCTKGQLLSPLTVIPLCWQHALLEMQRLGHITAEGANIRTTVARELAKYGRTVHQLRSVGP